MVISRRRLLQGLGAGSALLPFVPILGANAQGGSPKRIIFFYSSNGTVHERWVPSLSGGELELSFILEPLQRHRERLLVVDGLDYTVNIEKGDKDGHYGGMNTALTGSPSRIVDPSDPDERSLATGISVDQLIANTVSEGLKFKSLECGIKVDDYAATVAALSYAGSMQPLLPENDPYAVFDRVFGGFTPDGPDPAVEERLTDRRSVLDFVRGDLNRLRGRLATEERIKVDAHLDAVRAIEQSLTTGSGDSATESCEVPGLGTMLDPQRNDDIPALGRLQTDLLVMAMACDLTRVGTIQHGRAGAQHRFTWLGPEFNSDPDNGPNDSTSGIHGLAHNEQNPDSREKLARCHQWYAGEVAYLLDKLAAIPEAGGTMLDNTLVVWMNEMGTGNHLETNTPWVIAGNVDGHFKTDHMVSVPGTPHNRLLLSLCHAMGLNETTFGDPDYGSDPLAGLT